MKVIKTNKFLEVVEYSSEDEKLFIRQHLSVSEEDNDGNKITYSFNDPNSFILSYKELLTEISFDKDYIPVGLEDHLRSREVVIDIVEDRTTEVKLRTIDNSIFSDKNITLNDHQVETINYFAKNYEKTRRSIIQIPTRGRKTLITAGLVFSYMFDSDKPVTIVIPSNSTLLEQTVSVFKNQAGFDNVSVAYSEKEDLNENTKILIVLVNTLFNRLKNKPEDALSRFYKNSGLVIFDETQFLGSPMFSFCYLKSNFDVFVTTSGTPYFSGDESEYTSNYRDFFVKGLTGGIIYKIGYDTLIAAGIISQPYYYQFGVKTSSYDDYYLANNYYSLYKSRIIYNENRNRIILDVVRKCIFYSVGVMVIVNEDKHGLHLLEKYFKNEKFTSAYYSSSYSMTAGNGRFEDNPNAYELFKNKQVDVLVGCQLFDIGVDFPNLDLYVYAAAGANFIKNTQRPGRALNPTEFEDLNISLIVDFYDNTHMYFKSQSERRKAIYEKNSYKVLDSSTQLFSLLKALSDRRTLQ